MPTPKHDPSRSTHPIDVPLTIDEHRTIARVYGVDVRTKKERRDHGRQLAAARRLADEPVIPFPPTTTIRVFERGTVATLQPVADVLSDRTRATLTAIKGGNQ